MTEIYSGELRHRMVIERRNTNIGLRGESLEEWSEIGRCWAKVTPLFGRELEVARKRQENIAVKIITRRQVARDMDPTYRLRHDGNVYNVGFVNIAGADLMDIHVFCGSTRGNGNG